jgi:Fur family ferric uptake transcriptional regulator
MVIFEMEKHFTVEVLQKELKKRKYYISKTTLYNTISLLVEAGLILKHYFPSEPSAQYEKFFNVIAHNHVYREDTDEVFEFSDERIDNIIKDIEKKYNVTATRHSFTIYCKKN